MSDIDELIDGLLGDVVYKLNLQHCNMRSWLICYNDPTLSAEENARRATDAVTNGWTPDKLLA